LGKTEGRGSKEGSRKEAGGKGEEEKTEERKDSRSQESSRGVGNLEQRRRSSEIRGRSKKDDAQEVLPIDKDIWEEIVGKNAN